MILKKKKSLPIGYSINNTNKNKRGNIMSTHETRSASNTKIENLTTHYKHTKGNKKLRSIAKKANALITAWSA